MRTRVIAILAAVVVAGCSQRNEFNCSGNPLSACGAGGTWEANGFCSFLDSTCSSGRRYGDLGGPSGRCVGEEPPIDARLDTPPPDARLCFGAAPFTICFPAPPSGSIDVSMATTFDTVTGTVTGTQLNCSAPTSGGTGYCVIAANTITIGAPLRAVGTKPLVLVAATSISVPAAGSIAVGSHRMGGTDSLGAGADPNPGCNVGNLPSSANGTSGGGAGGSFLGAGGNGGNGGNGGGGAGTRGPTTNSVTTLRGGCPGQDGAGNMKGGRGHGG